MVVVNSLENVFVRWVGKVFTVMSLFVPGNALVAASVLPQAAAGASPDGLERIAPTLFAQTIATATADALNLELASVIQLGQATIVRCRCALMDAVITVFARMSSSVCVTMGGRETIAQLRFVTTVVSTGNVFVLTSASATLVSLGLHVPKRPSVLPAAAIVVTVWPLDSVNVLLAGQHLIAVNPFVHRLARAMASASDLVFAPALRAGRGKRVISATARMLVFMAFVWPRLTPT